MPRRRRGCANVRAVDAPLWLTNEVGSHRYWREEARSRRRKGRQDATEKLAEQLKGEVEEATPISKVPRPGLRPATAAITRRAAGPVLPERDAILLGFRALRSRRFPGLRIADGVAPDLLAVLQIDRMDHARLGLPPSPGVVRGRFVDDGVARHQEIRDRNRALELLAHGILRGAIVDGQDVLRPLQIVHVGVQDEDVAAILGEELIALDAGNRGGSGSVGAAGGIVTGAADTAVGG